MTAEQVMTTVRESGQVWLGDEMTFPADEGADRAFAIAYLIAKQRGYFMTWVQRHESFKVSGGNIFGYYSLQWRTGKKELDTVTHCIAHTATRQP